jgi:hypothetical protein
MKQIQYLNNPCQWGASESKPFTYEGGAKLYHFNPSTCVKYERFDHWIPVNVIFFANNEKHALDIIERMLRFRLKKKPTAYDDHGRQLAQVILDHKDEWKVNEAPTDQFYTVSWASNDTIL